MKTSFLLLPSLVSSALAFTVVLQQQRKSSSTLLRDIVSPFDNSGDTDVATTTASSPAEPLEGPLELTWENVDAVLDEMRPYLIQDGGNVKIDEIDGPVVKLQLEVSNFTEQITTVALCYLSFFDFLNLLH